MKLYAIVGCPFVERVKIYISYQKISEKLKIENIDLSNPPASLLKVNSSGSVPTLLFNDSTGFGESMLVIEYLDSTLPPESRLFGETEVEKTKLKAQLSLLDDVFLNAVRKALYSKGLYNSVHEAGVELIKGYKFFEEFLKIHNDFFRKNAFTMFDVLLAPFIMRFLALSKIQTTLPQPQVGSEIEKFFERIKSNAHVHTACVGGEELITVVKKHGTPNTELQTILNATRSILSSPNVNELNVTKHSADIKISHPLWTVQHGAKGPNLFSSWTFPSWQSAANAFKRMQDICDTVDHHVDLNIKNMTTFEISLCTHEPKWGISEKDFALAKVLSSLLL